LLALLAGTAGCIDALSYLRLGNVFTANMTGNAVLLGIATGQQVAARALHSVAALAGFALGVLAGAALCGRHQGSEAGGWPPRVTLALGVELVVLGAWAGSRGALVRQSGVLLALVAGAVAGAAVLGVAGGVAAMVPAVLVAVVVAVAARARPAPEDSQPRERA